jgi:hypothetical protein
LLGKKHRDRGLFCRVRAYRDTAARRTAVKCRKIGARSRALSRKVLASLKSIIGEAMRRGLVLAFPERGLSDKIEILLRQKAKRYRFSGLPLSAPPPSPRNCDDRHPQTSVRIS